MRRSVAMALAILAFYWTAAPLLACVLPERAMTAQEHECCKHMAEMCGSSQMPQSHSCCKPASRPDNSIVVRIDWRPAPVLQVVATVPLPSSLHFSEGLRPSEHHHPPGEFLPETTVLRI
jgi:hypothetical protein